MSMMTKKFSPDVETLRGLFTYKEGYLYSKVDRHKNPIGRKVDNVPNGQGYILLQIGDCYLKAHRVIFAIVHGYMPLQVDHINGIRSDNRIENLRDCTHMQNSMNVKSKLGESGVQGVSRYYNKWRARLGVEGKRISLGIYDDLELAELVVNEARDKYHKQFSVLRRLYESK